MVLAPRIMGQSTLLTPTFVGSCLGVTAFGLSCYSLSLVLPSVAWHMDTWVMGTQA